MARFIPLISSAKSCSTFRNSKKTITNFRSSSSSSFSTCSSSSSPWLILPPTPEEDGKAYNFFSLADNKVICYKDTTSAKTPSSRRAYKLISYKDTTAAKTTTSSSSPDVDESEFVGSSHGWIALFNRRNTDLFLLNPLTGRHVKLPPMYTISKYTPPNKYSRHRPWVDKLIITCPPESPSCRAVMMYDGNQLAYCTPGSSTRWTGPIDPAHCTPRVGNWVDWGWYEDFVYYPKSGLLLCIGHVLEGWDIISSEKNETLVFQNNNLLYYYHYRQTPRVSSEEYGHRPISQQKHLVVHGCDIFLVLRDYVYMKDDDDDYPCKTVGFHVHRIEADGSLGESEGSLDGLAMFVGRNHSFALRADDYPGIVPNSVYFTQHWSLIPPRSPVDSAYGGHDIGVFDYESKTISPCYYPCDVDSFKKIMPAPMWFTPNP